MDTISALGMIAQAAENNNPPAPGDYKENGLLMCGRCHTQKQTIVPGLGLVSCQCSCDQERDARKEEARKQREREGEIKRLQSMGVHDKKTLAATFQRDDGKNPQMERLRKYVEQWEAMEADNQGLLLYGGCGTGKSFGAACIANALREKGFPVYFNTTAEIVQDVHAMSYNEDELKAFKHDLQKYPLVVLDDFGVERQTEYVLETLYTVIDTRYRAGKPLIITTNLPLETIVNEKEADLSKRRIYDRVREACAIPVDFGNAGRRKGIAQEKFKEGAKLLRE